MKYTRLKLGVFGILIAFIAFLFTRPFIYVQAVDSNTAPRLKEVMEESLENSFHSDRFVDAGMATYGDFEEVTYIVDNVETSINTIPTSDVVVKAAIPLHKVDICFMERVTTLDSSSLVYKRYIDSPYFTGDHFYTSCPINVNGKLIGYVDVLIYIRPFGLLPNYNFVRLAAINLSKVLENEL